MSRASSSALNVILTPLNESRIDSGRVARGIGISTGEFARCHAIVIAYADTHPAPTSIPGTLTYTQPTRAGYRVYRFTAGSGTVTL